MPDGNSKGIRAEAVLVNQLLAEDVGRNFKNILVVLDRFSV